MDIILDQELEDSPKQEIFFGSPLPRFWAALIDGIILTPFILILHFAGLSGKTAFIYGIVLNSINVFYNPFLEYYYGSTFGKMVLKLKVVNENFQKPDLKNILLRHSLTLVPGLLLIASDLVYHSKVYLMSYNEYDSVYNGHLETWISRCMGFLIIIDGIFLLKDGKYYQALHDKIGKTFVIQT